uniref:Uncharacterized protein n=1 Tax=Aegilops tauschii subsp. strangulata TaxID=200361 RepID=A0A453DYP2_AEGTS
MCSKHQSSCSVNLNPFTGHFHVVYVVPASRGTYTRPLVALCGKPHVIYKVEPCIQLAKSLVAGF